MPLSQRRQGSAQQAHTTDAASAAAVSFLIGGSALTEACDILLAQQQSAQSRSTASGPQSESQNQDNEDHCQKLAALYQKGKAAYNVLCRADNAPDIMSIMTPGNASAKPLSAGHFSQSSLSATANNTPLPRSRGSFTTPHGNKSKLMPGLIHRKREGSFGGNGARIISRSLSDTSDVSNTNGASGSGNNNSHREGAKSANNVSVASKKSQQQQQQKPHKADPPPEVMNFLKALNAGGSKAAPASTSPPSSSSSTTAAGAANNNNNDSNATNSRKRPPLSSAPKQSNKKRTPPPPPRRRQSSRSSASNDDEHDEPNVETTATATRRTRSKRRGASMNANYTRVFDIGETVFVQVDGKHYNAIVKNVDFKDDEDDPNEEGGDDNDTMKVQRPVYEVEFSDGEVMEDVGGDDVHSADEEGW